MRGQCAWRADIATLQMVVRDLEDKPGEREVAGVDWIFNAWGGLEGGLYKDWSEDQKVGGAALPRQLYCRV